MMIETTERLHALRLEELKYFELKVNLQKKLPHLHGWKFYKWAQEYWDATNDVQLICAANQISKSSTQIRKHIHWATEKSLWEKLWRSEPRQFWYLYPTRDVAHVEWLKKWKPEFMPRGEFKDDPKYGWKEEIYHGRIFAIHWNSSISTYFKTYAQDVSDLQTGTVAKLDLDEECPEELMSELSMRLAATNGYLSAVFTPTLGQEYWRQAIEERGPLEKFPNAFKRQVSMYDCLYYADGTKSPWSLDQIRRAENACKSQSEIDRRVYGRFVVAEGLKYPSFHRLANRKPGHPIPKGWSIHAGIDIGSGGDDNHPSAIVFVGVNPEFTQGRVFKGWRGDGEVTTVSDVVHKFVQMCQELKINPNEVSIQYDWASRDFYNIATSMGLVVEPAEKSHAIGEQVLNVLFKNHMLMVYDYPELDPLVNELSSLKNATPKNKAKDDFTDATRYACSKIPWNWDFIRSDKKVDEKPEEEDWLKRELRERREHRVGVPGSQLISVEDELAGWNELMGDADPFE